MSLTFDEFHAVRKRERNTKLQVEDDDDRDENESVISNKSSNFSDARTDFSIKTSSSTNNSNNNIKDAGITSTLLDKNVSWFKWMGNFVELQEFQLMVIGLIFMDILATLFSIVFNAKAISEVVPESTVLLRSSILNMMKSFLDFTVFFFTFELAVLIISFRSAVLFHFGYMTDMFVLSLILFQSFFNTDMIPAEYRLIGLLRLWRVVRLVNSMMLVAQSKSEEAMNLLRAEQVKAKETKKEINRQEGIIRRDGESRKRLEQMLQGYKDEIETLNEALKIAALDVAMVAEDDSEDEDFVEEQNNANTIFVNEDGSYDVKST